MRGSSLKVDGGVKPWRKYGGGVTVEEGEKGKSLEREYEGVQGKEDRVVFLTSIWC